MKLPPEPDISLSGGNRSAGNRADGGSGCSRDEAPSGDLTQIPGIGENMEHHLNNIGIRCIADLKGKDPEELYHQNCLKKGYRDDRCVLYVFRCAVYYAEHEQREPEKLKWWYWKDKEYPQKEQESVLQTCSGSTEDTDV